ncbi:MAG: phasin family protein [Actinomycetota bacterium]
MREITGRSIGSTGAGRSRLEVAVLDELRRVAMFSSGVAELTRYRAEQIVKDLVKAGDVRREQASTIVRDLLETSKASRSELLRFVRSEIQSQVATLGLASQRDLDRLERRVARLESERSAAPKKSAAKKTTAKRSTARKSTGAKSTSSGSSSS